MKAVVRRMGGISLAGLSESGHWVPMDGPSDLGGSDAAAKPLELVLIGLGGCTSIDILSILRKRRIKLDDYEVELEAGRAETHPRVFTSIRLTFHFYGEDLPREDLELAVRLSEEKYCSVSAMLRASMPIETRVELHPPREAR